jgi:uracil-DNA glycosylase family 4
METGNQSPWTDLHALSGAIVRCGHCPRLVAWREAVAETRIRRHAGESYWGRPVPGFGDPAARLLLVGLAPAAHGGNRTGRVFTGDRSGDWLFRALYKAGFASQPESTGLSDGLRLADCYVTATVRCAPPDNKPSREESATCRPYLENELALLPNVRVIVALGGVAWEAVLKLPAFAMPAPTSGIAKPRKARRPRFTHGEIVKLANGVHLIGSYHPSQQNTFTGRLTEPMLDHVFMLARKNLESQIES